MKFLFGGPKAPKRVPTDTVIPLHFVDDSPIFHRIVLYNMLVFDDVLDVDQLRGSLGRLIQRDTWKKLGGRVRRHGKGALAYHIPVEFTAERPAIGVTHIRHIISKRDHPLASRLPKPSNKPAVVGDPDEFTELVRGPTCPSSVDDYLYTDRPVLGLHIVSFNDATLVTLHWLHVACDALGFRALMDGWVLMLQGREHKVLPLHGYDYDPLKELGKHAEEKHLLADKRLTVGGSIQFGLRNGPNFTIRAKENRMVFIPRWFVEKKRNSVLDELRTKAKDGKEPFVTEGDILVAWWTRIVTSHLGTDSRRTVTVMNAYSLRKVLKQDLLPPNGIYVSNCIGFINMILSTRDVLQKPLSWLAFHMRECINNQGTRNQVEAYQKMVRDQPYPLPVFLGDGKMHHISYSNWSKANLFQTDFAAAAVTPRSTPCYPSYIQHTQLGLQFPEGFLIMGKDADGNYWMCGYRVKGLWDVIEKELEKDVAES